MTAGDADEQEPWCAAAGAIPFDVRVLASDVDADICIIGGSICGLTIARELARRDWSVVVLEPGRIGAHGLARGLGIVTPEYAQAAERIVERVGHERARQLFRLSSAGVDYVRAAATEAGTGGAVVGDGVLVVQSVDDERGCRRQVELLRDALGVSAAFWSTEKVREVARSGAHRQAVYLPHAFSIDPLNYTCGLAADARRTGALIYERTEALAVDSDGVRKRVPTKTGLVRARQVVLASSAAARLRPPLGTTTLSLPTWVGVTEPLGDRPTSAVRFPGAVIGRDAAGLAHRITDGDRLLWLGPLGMPASTRSAGDRLRRQIQRCYPQLGPVTIERTWTARVDYAVHRMPQIGELAPGLWLASAFGLHGIATATMAADLIVQALHAGDDCWRLFQPYGLVWAGGWMGRAVTRMALGSIRLRAQLRTQLAGRLPAAPAAIATEGGRAQQSAIAMQAPDAAHAAVSDQPSTKPRSKGTRRRSRQGSEQTATDDLPAPLGALEMGRPHERQNAAASPGTSEAATDAR